MEQVGSSVLYSKLLSSNTGQHTHQLDWRFHGFHKRERSGSNNNESIFHVLSASQWRSFVFYFWAEWSQWQPLKEIMNFRKLHLSNYLLFGSILQFVEPILPLLEGCRVARLYHSPRSKLRYWRESNNKNEDQEPFGYMDGFFFFL